MSKLTKLKVAGFRKLSDSFAITQEVGTYRQAELYERAGAIFCRKGTGYLKIYDTGHTSNPKVIVIGVNIKGKKWRAGRFGVLEVAKDAA